MANPKSTQQALQQQIQALQDQLAEYTGLEEENTALRIQLSERNNTIVALNQQLDEMRIDLEECRNPTPEPEPEPEPEPADDWAAVSADALVAYRLIPSNPGVDLTKRHRLGNDLPFCLWVPDENTYTKPVIDEQGLRFDIEPNKGAADAVFKIPAFGANSKLRARWVFRGNAAFVNTVFRMADGGYPGIKMMIFATLAASSPSGKFVLTCIDQHKFLGGYRYSWATGATENFEPAVDSNATDFDWQPKQGQAPTCLYTVVNKTPQGVAVPGCDTLVPDKDIILEVEIYTGGVIAGTIGRAWDAEYRCYMTVDGVRKLVFDYGKTTRGYQGRRAEPFTALWAVPFMTGRDLTQTFPSTPSVWIRELVIKGEPTQAVPVPTPDPVPVPDPTPTPDPVPVPDPTPDPSLPSFVPSPGTFAEFTTNVPTDLAPASDPWIKAALLANWTGGAFVDDFGAAGAAVYHGGGEHFSWDDRGGVLVLDVAAQKYVMRCVSSPKHMGVVSGPTGPAGSLTDRFGAYQDNGYPQSKHTYNSLVQFPKAWGGGTQGGLVRVCHAGGLTNPTVGAAPGYGLAATWAFDLSQEINGAVRLTGEQTYDLGSGQPAYTNDAPGAGIDWLREGWWVFARTGSGTGDRMVFTHKSGRIDPPGTPSIALNWGRLHHFADDDTLVALASAAGVYICHPGNPWKTMPYAVAEADKSDWDAIAGYLGYTGPQWCSILNCFVGIDTKPVLNADGSRNLNAVRVWKIIPPETAAKRWTDPWFVERETLTSADGSQIDMATDHAVNAGNGTSYGKLVECKAMRSLVWTRRVDRKGQLMRLRGM